MKKQLLGLLFAMLGLVCAAYAHDGDNKPKPTPVCSMAELRGAYSFRLSGEVYKPLDQDGKFGPDTAWDDRDERHKVNPLKLRGLAELVFDGKGNFTSEDEIVLEGKPISAFASSGASGVYTVNADCTGSLYLQFKDRRFPLDIDIDVSDDGRTIFAIVNSCGSDRRKGVLSVEAVGRKDFVRRHDFDDDDDKGY